MGNKTPAGEASIQVHRDRLRVRFPRSLFGGKLKTLALGLPNDKRGWREAEKKLRAIQSDIDLGVFDQSLAKYGFKKQEPVKAISLIELWDEYMTYKKPLLKATTTDLLSSVNRYIDRSGIVSPYEALKLREWLLANSTQGQTKWVLMQINAAFKWGLKHGRVTGSNPYEGMAQEFQYSYQREEKGSSANALKKIEKEKILTEFERLGYGPFIRFLLLTGCRPSEAVGLRWKDISPDFSAITFNGSLYKLRSGGFSRQKGSKNNRSRIFPCNSELVKLLEELPEPKKPDHLIFTSPKKEPINYRYFGNLWRDKCGSIKPGSTPYSCRDTFITEQITKGVNPLIVAKWVDNSVDTIERHYFDSKAIDHIVPL